MTTLLATGLASFGNAQLPLHVTAHPLNALIAARAPQQDEEKPKQQDEKKPKGTQESKPKADKQDKPAAKQDNAQKRPDVAKQDQRQDLKQDRKEDKGQAGSRRVSDSDLKAHFGQEHKFSVRTVVTTTTIVPNQTQFVYSGYTFVFAQAWPAGWAMEDDCYLDYIDGGYFLVDVVHPGLRIAVTIAG